MAVARRDASRASPAMAVPRQLHRRARLRDQRAGRPRPQRVGSGLRSRRARAGITPYGTETMHVLRAEKGYIIVGQETDGTATPLDAGLAWAIGRKKPDFVGKRSLERAAMQSPDRRQLVGLLHARRRASCWRRARRSPRRPGQPAPMKVIGHVTSSYASARARPFDRARDGRGRPRARGRDALRADARAARSRSTVTRPVFYDPEGARLHG